MLQVNATVQRRSTIAGCIRRLCRGQSVFLPVPVMSRVSSLWSCHAGGLSLKPQQERNFLVEGKPWCDAGSDESCRTFNLCKDVRGGWCRPRLTLRRDTQDTNAKRQLVIVLANRLINTNSTLSGIRWTTQHSRRAPACCSQDDDDD